MIEGCLLYTSCNALFCEVNPIPVKTALNMMGMGAGAFRMPLCEMEDVYKRQCPDGIFGDAGAAGCM